MNVDARFDNDRPGQFSYTDCNVTDKTYITCLERSSSNTNHTNLFSANI